MSQLKKTKGTSSPSSPNKSYGRCSPFAWPHTSRHTTAEIVKIGWEVLPHPPHSPDLAPSDFHLFGPLKEAQRGIHFKDEETVKTSVRQWLGRQDLAFTGLEYMPLLKGGPKRWKLTDIILKSDKFMVNVVVFKLCNCIWVFLKSKGEKK